MDKHKFTAFFFIACVQTLKATRQKTKKNLINHVPEDTKLPFKSFKLDWKSAHVGTVKPVLKYWLGRLYAVTSKLASCGGTTSMTVVAAGSKQRKISTKQTVREL